MRWMAPRAKNRQGRAPRVALIVLAALGLGISAYLTWTHFLGVPPMCISGSGGCETVQSSRYAAIFGVPVAALGVVAYAGCSSRPRYGVRQGTIWGC